MITPLDAIKRKCLKCSHGSKAEVENCTLKNKCPLYPFRFGTIPVTVKNEYGDDVIEKLGRYKKDEINRKDGK